MSDAKAIPPAAVSKIITWICSGVRADEIADLVRTGKVRGLAVNLFAEALAAAENGIVQVAADHQCDLPTARTLIRLNDLYKTARLAKDYKAALAVEKELSRVLGGTPPAAETAAAVDAADARPGDAVAVSVAEDLYRAIAEHLEPQLAMGEDTDATYLDVIRRAGERLAELQAPKKKRARKKTRKKKTTGTRTKTKKG